MEPFKVKVYKLLDNAITDKGHKGQHSYTSATEDSYIL